MKAKKNILVFIDWFYPGFLAGGPVQSIVSLVEYLHEDFQFWIFTSNRDLNSREPYADINSNIWLDSPLNCKVYYADEKTLSKDLIGQILGSQKWDKVYINSLFSKYYSVVPLLLLKRKFKHLPVIVAPRGMFGAGALSIKKIKKKSFLFYANHSGLHKRVVWHAASKSEAEEIKERLGNEVSIVMVPNLSKGIKALKHKPKIKGELSLFFSARISQKKNLQFALELLSQVKKGRINFNIYGLIEDKSYWQQCLNRISKLPENVKSRHMGTYQPHEAVAVFSKEQVLFLPTLNENYGHSIVESLSCGCPVLISDQTPWTDLQEHGAGYALPLSNPQAFVEAIETLASMDEIEFSHMRNKAVEYTQRKINVDAILQQYKSLFHE
ncbi:MAG: glycosyltransferase family 4 protein [Bacteroidia bacterium]|nr:glycosyltransferase family 4 protein [Bacteroidia bacterium]